jgi:hypothetical protein
MEKKLLTVPCRAVVLLLVSAVLVACGGCVTTSQRGDRCATPPPSTNVLLIEPDIILFELTAGGLKRQGVAFGSIHEGKLLLMVYSGTREYYFEKHKQEVETLFSSVELVN